LIDEAKNIPEEDPKIFDDPYSIEKLLFYWSHGKEGLNPINPVIQKEIEIDSKTKTDTVAEKLKQLTQNSLNTQINLNKLNQYNKNFNADIFNQSFSAAKISNIIKTFGWKINILGGNWESNNIKKSSSSSLLFKKLIDKYDFDGNGRLDVREFLFFAIMENYKKNLKCKKHCLKEIIENKINPMFNFFDCDDDGFINSENLWNGMKYLKRQSPENYNFYKCEIPKVFNKYYRTHATNDFVLKNYEAVKGYLNIEEFRKGILLGYWERQIKINNVNVSFIGGVIGNSNLNGVVLDDSVNRKSERWDDNGKKDIDCEEILSMS
jgi:Ca2+-binding EF-hand superfamily protein